RRLAGAAHADQIRRQASRDACGVRDDVAPEVRRRRIAVQEDDRTASPRIDVCYLAVEDGDAATIVTVGGGHHWVDQEANYSTPPGRVSVGHGRQKECAATVTLVR